MHRVLVPVDDSVQRADKQAEYVTSLPGAPEELEVKFIHVNPADYEGAKTHELADVESVGAARERIEDAGIDYEAELLEGVVPQTILDAAEEFDADQVVMAGRKRSGVAKVLLGSVSQDIVLSTERPVTIVG